jgi:YHS domain-containing protein
MKGDDMKTEPKMMRAAIIFMLSFVVYSFSAAQARAPEIYLDKGGAFRAGWDYAVGGNDVVAYFDLNEGDAPVAGVDAYVADYKGVQWRFASAENLAKFKANPDQYSPQYGGYCSWAMARDKFAKGDPKVWYVYEGKLFLNVSQRYKREWLAEIDRDIARANANWPKILDRP